MELQMMKPTITIRHLDDEKCIVQVDIPYHAEARCCGTESVEAIVERLQKEFDEQCRVCHITSQDHQFRYGGSGFEPLRGRTLETIRSEFAERHPLWDVKIVR